MLDGIKAGQTIKCTITREPHNRGARVTLLRLMQRDPSIKRALSKAQQLHRRRMHRYIRGNRLYSAPAHPQHRPRRHGRVVGDALHARHRAGHGRGRRVPERREGLSEA